MGHQLLKETADNLTAMKQHAYGCLLSAARSLKDLDSHQWKHPDALAQFNEHRTTFIRDLTEFRSRLDDIATSHTRVVSKRGGNPHHPEILKVGGEYITFIEDVTAVLVPSITMMLTFLNDDNGVSENV